MPSFFAHRTIMYQCEEQQRYPDMQGRGDLCPKGHKGKEVALYLCCCECLRRRHIYVYCTHVRVLRVAICAQITFRCGTHQRIPFGHRKSGSRCKPHPGKTLSTQGRNLANANAGRPQRNRPLRIEPTTSGKEIECPNH